MDHRSALPPSGAVPSGTGAARVRGSSAVVRYGFAVIATLVAVLFKLALGPVILPSFYVPFYGAVLVSAWVGGVGPGVLASVLSFGIGQVLYSAPLAPPPSNAQLAMARDLLFLCVAIGWSWGIAALHASQRRVTQVLQAARDELDARVTLRTAELRETNRQLTDEMARRSEAEERFRNAFEYAPIGMALISPDGRPLQINAALCHMLGYTHEELIHKPIAEVMHPDDFAIASADRARLLSGEIPGYRAERRYLHRSGAVVWAEMNVSVVRDSQGRPLHIVSHLHDITERTLADQALKESEGKFRTLAETVPVATVIFQGSVVRYANPAAAAISGYTREELCTMPFWEIVHPDYRALLQGRGLARQRGENVPAHDEARIVTKSRETRWVDFGAALIDFEGAPAVLGTAFDVTERKRAETLLRESEERFRGTFEQAAVGIAHVGPDGRWLRVNSRLCEIVGYAEAELLAGAFQDITHPDDLDADLEYVRQMLEGKIQTYSMEKRYIRKDGSQIWIELTVSLVCDPSGVVKYFISVVRDIEARKRAEEALRRNEELLKDQTLWLQSILNSLGEAVVVADEKGKLLYFNPVAERLHGRGLADVAPENWSHEYGICFPDGTPVPSEQLPLAQARFGVTSTANQEFAVRPYERNSLIPVSVTATPLVSEDGSVRGGVIVYRDISNIKEAEARLRRNEERLKEAERLAHAGAWEWDLTTGEAIWSDEQFRIFGLEPCATPPLYDVILGQVVPEDRQRIEEAVQDAFAGTRPFEVEYRLVRPHGEIRYVHSRGKVVRDVTGRVLRMMGTAVDITERKQAESLLEARVAERTTQLRTAEERLRRLVEHLPAITYVLGLDAAQSTLYISPQVEALLGFSPQEWMSDPDLWNRQLHPYDRERVISEVAASHATGAPFSSEYRMHTRDGTLLWFHDEAAVIRGENGTLLFSQGVMIDITARKVAEEELEAANRRTQDILEEITDGFFTLDEAARFTYLNRSAVRLLRRSLDELVGKNIWETFPGAEGSAFYEQHHRVMTERVSLDVQSYYPPTNRWLRAHAYPFQRGIAVLFEDVTEAHEKEVGVVSDILRALNAHLRVDAAFADVAAGLQALTSCDRSSLMLFDEEYETATVVGLDQTRLDVAPGTRLRTCDIPVVPNVMAGRPHAVPDLAAELHSPIVQRLYADGFRSALCLPLHGSNRVTGMLSLTWRKVDGPNGLHLPLLGQIGDAVALAVEKERLFDEVRGGRERLQALSHRLLEVQEAERHHIARELHDEIGQLLTALKLTLDMIDQVPAESAVSRLHDAQQLANDLVTRVRDLSLDLRPAMLDDLGLLPALLWLFGRYSMQTSVGVRFEHNGLDRRFSPDLETAAYRIVQEALTNVARHAGVREATVRVWTSDHTLSVQIADLGKGFDREAVLAAGLTGGLSGLHERGLLLGGQVTIESTPGRGTRVRAELPLVDVVDEESARGVQEDRR